MGHEFEKFYRSIGSAPSVVACPECGKTAERQLSAGGGLVFKGSGFYITDYGKDGKKPQPSSPPPASDSGKPAPGGEAAAKGESGSKTPASGDSKASSETKAPATPKPAAEKSTKRAKDKE